MLKMLTPPVKASIISFLIAAPAFGAKIMVTERYEIDSAERVAEVQASDGLDIAEGAVVDYSAADDLVLTDSTPVTGSGSFVHASGGKLLLLGNNSAFAGAWYVTNATVIVSNRYGLGSSATKGAFFKSDSSHRQTTLHFGGAGLTNDVPLTLDGSFNLKDNHEEELIFNGLVSRGPNATYISTGNTHFRGGFKGLGNSPTFEPSGANASVTKETWIYFESRIAEGGYLMLHGSNNAVQHFVISNDSETAKNSIGLLECYRGYLHCASRNVFGSTPNTIRLGGPYDTKEWKTAVFDLNGFDQTATTLFFNESGSPRAREEDGEKFVTEVTSAEPATLTLTAADSTTATKFTGAVSLLLNGKGKTYSLANLVSTTTGKMTLANGANAVIKWNAGWTGSVEIGEGSRLTVSSPRAFVGGMSDVTVVQGGVLEVSADAGVSVKTLRLGGKDIPAGHYTVAGLTACGYGDFVAGAGEIFVVGSGEETVEVGPNPVDALVFDLALTNETAVGETVKTAEILDNISYSAATPYLPSYVTGYYPARDPAGYEKYRQPELISVQKAKVVENYRYKLGVTNEMNVLHFPKNLRTSGGDTAAFAQGIRWESLPPLTSNVTFYIRYRWDGNFVQPSDVQYDQYLFQLADPETSTSFFVAGVEASPPSKASAMGYPRCGVGGPINSPKIGFVKSNMQDIVPGHWIDAFFICERAGTNTNVTVYRFDVEKNGSLFNRWELTIPRTMDFAGGGRGRLILGNFNSYFGNFGLNGQDKWIENAPGHVYSTFTGDIAKFKIFNRALSLVEINALLGGGGGGMTLKVGSRNGKGDEFAAADDANVADPYDPVNMPVRRMRKALDAAHPTLTLKFPLLPEEERLAKTLRVVITRDDVLGSIPVVLKVNGVEVETLGFDEGINERFAFIRSPRMVRDADGNVTVTLTRPSPAPGTVFIDTIEMSGGWMVGVENDSSSDWCFADVTLLCDASGWMSRLGVIGGERGIPYLYKQNYGLRKDHATTYYPAQQIAFDVPKEVLAAQCPLTFSFKRNMSAYGQLDVSVNGTPIYHDGPNETGLKSRTLTLPPELVNPGYNVLCVSNSSCTFAESQEASGYNSISYDFFRFSFKPPSTGKGLVLIVR